MISNNHFIFLLLSLLLWVHPVSAQDEGSSGEETLEDIVLTPEQWSYLSGKIEAFTDEATTLLESIDGVQAPQLKAIKRYANAMDLKWNGFYGMQLALISSDDDLLAAASSFLEVQQKITEAIEQRDKALTQLTEFIAAERVVAQSLKKYETMHKDAYTFSLVQKLAPQLEQLKAKEQISMEDVTGQYEKAKAAAADNKQLAPRWEKLENNYISIKAYSQQIQALEYKPLLQRLKDNLMSLAAVAILLMFVSFIVMRIQSFRKAQKAAQELKKQQDRMNPDIPTI